MTKKQLDDLGLPEGYAFDAAWEVTPRAVKVMQEQGELVVFLDCRLAKEVAAAKIEDTTHIPMQSVEDRLAELEPHTDCRVVVF